MRESKKNACNDSAIIAGVFGVSGILENPVELVLVFNTTQKVYYTETKSTFKTFGTEIMLPLQLKKKTNHILWI